MYYLIQPTRVLKPFFFLYLQVKYQIENEFENVFFTINPISLVSDPW